MCGALKSGLSRDRETAESPVPRVDQGRQQGKTEQARDTLLR